MKNKIIALSLIINVILIGMLYNLLNMNERTIGKKQVLKEMSTSEREEELDNEIKKLTTSATEYATYVQTCKAQIASAITEKGISTNETDTLDVMVENIKSISTDETKTLYIETGYVHFDGWENTTLFTRVYIDGVEAFLFTGKNIFKSEEFTI